MLNFNPHSFGDTLQARVCILSRAWCCPRLEGNCHLISFHLALRDSGCALGLVQSPDPE